MLQDVILEGKKKTTKKIDLESTGSRDQVEVATNQVKLGRSGRIRKKSRLSKSTHGRSSCGNTNPDLSFPFLLLNDGDQH
jgi:hypothetical protein